ncbi:MAG: hypothetical protein KDD70_16995 [Bdellovibrionales bacterium]|nr:hypothetical protein [Bdellovibrionales bacterium]
MDDGEGSPLPEAREESQLVVFEVLDEKSPGDKRMLTASQRIPKLAPEEERFFSLDEF